ARLGTRGNRDRLLFRRRSRSNSRSHPGKQPRRDVTNDPSEKLSGRGYGNIYTPHAGSMIIQVQRESGLANRTIILTQRQVRLLRRGAYAVGTIFAIVLLSWFFLATQAARVPGLTRRVETLQHDVIRLDTLQAALTALESRFQQVQHMLGASTPQTGEAASTPAAPAADTASNSVPSQWPLAVAGTIIDPRYGHRSAGRHGGSCLGRGFGRRGQCRFFGHLCRSDRTSRRLRDHLRRRSRCTGDPEESRGGGRRDRCVRQPNQWPSRAPSLRSASQRLERRSHVAHETRTIEWRSSIRTRAQRMKREAPRPAVALLCPSSPQARASTATSRPRASFASRDASKVRFTPGARC